LEIETMRVTFVEWVDGLQAGSREWSNIAAQLAAERPDILVTNEMPFGEWIASEPVFEAGRNALADLGIPVILSSRPVWKGIRLANQAFVLTKNELTPLRHKRYFPSEPGWEEKSWFVPDGSDFRVHDLGNLTMGVLLCTEAMFNEHARDYGVDGAALIAIPRATGADLEPWLTAGAMAALVSGSYVVSSNRVGQRAEGPRFGGGGFAYAPNGKLIGMTTPSAPLLTFDLDPHLAAVTQREGYPCYIARDVADSLAADRRDGDIGRPPSERGSPA
jgi:N-carbamoylputrescine amidase